MIMLLAQCREERDAWIKAMDYVMHGNNFQSHLVVHRYMLVFTNIVMYVLLHGPTCIIDLIEFYLYFYRRWLLREFREMDRTNSGRLVTAATD